jgi:hypothetical protein
MPGEVRKLLSISEGDIAGCVYEDGSKRGV